MREPETFGDYRLLRRVAFGGMAEIFLAEKRGERGFARRVALKRILPQFSADSGFVEMFVDEAVIVARLTHPNIVQIYDFGEVEGAHFIAMEWVDGVDLHRVLQAAKSRGRSLRPVEVATIGADLCKALRYAHATTDDKGQPLRIVHRDVSPTNIMVSRAGLAMLTDFGIAKASQRLTRTKPGAVKGKVAYMSPEQAAGDTVDARSDQFALGAVLWQCLTQERLFGGGADLDVMERVVRCVIDSPRQHRPDTPADLEAAIMRALAKTPADRFADLRELETELTAYRLSLGPQGAVDLGELVDSLGCAEGVIADARGGRRETLPLPARGQPQPWGEIGPPASRHGAVVTGHGTPNAEATTAPLEPRMADAAVAPAPVAIGEGATVPTTPAYRLSQAEATTERVLPPLDSRARRWAARAAALGVLVALGVAAFAPVGDDAPSRVAAPALVGTLRINSTPAGARIGVDGFAVGLTTPAVLPGQVLGASVELALELEGYEPYRQQMTIEAEGENLSVALVPDPRAMNPAARVPVRRPEPGRSAAEAPRAVVTPSRPSPTTRVMEAPATQDRRRPEPGRVTTRENRPAVQRASHAVAKEAEHRPHGASQGEISLRSTGPWVEVYLDQRRLGTTPLNRVALPAGTHQLRLVNTAQGVDTTITVVVVPGQETRRTVNVR